MRIVEWNCRSRFAAKLAALEALNPDVAVLAEAPLVNPWPDDTLTDKAVSWYAAGLYSYKSLALASFSVALTPIETPEGTGSWSIGAEHPAGFGILGIWACPEPSHPYSNEICKTLDAYEEWIRENDVVIAGDFNVTFDGTERKLFRPILERLEYLGMISAYHSHGGLEHGSETAATHFFRTHEEAEFHIDFVFCPDILDRPDPQRRGRKPCTVGRLGSQRPCADHCGRRAVAQRGNQEPERCSRNHAQQEDDPGSRPGLR